MKKPTTISDGRAFPRRRTSKFRSWLLLTMLSLFSLQSIHAGSATWNLDPGSGDWNDAANWTPNTVPNGPADTATFGVSNTTTISLSADTEVDRIIFNPGASGYQIRAREDQALTLSGAGIINNAGVAEKFVVGGDISFLNEATAGSSTTFTLTGLATMTFRGTSTAGDGTFSLNGTNRGSPQLFFYDSSTAGNGTFTLSPSVTSVADCIFFGSSSAGHAVFTAGGGVTFSCFVGFAETSTADNATLIAGAGINGGNGGSIGFLDDSTGGMARVILFGYGGTSGQSEGSLLIQHNPPTVTIGSVEGNGRLDLEGAFFLNADLFIGSNGLNTTFSGTMRDGGFAGPHAPLIKIGSGTLTLTNANTYAGGTKVLEGTLLVTDPSGRALGIGSVTVSGGNLGGTGRIGAKTTIGKGIGVASFLSPGVDGPGTCTFGKSLRFRSDAIYNCQLNSGTTAGDKAVAGGVTIDDGALISLVDLGSGTLPAGTTFRIIVNTAGTPISGTFSNLADGAIVNVNGNNLQASYSGGDGNDLTLTVVP